jgi:hypothetical protein
MASGLTANQRNRLRNRIKLSPQTRANTDYRLAKKLKLKLDGLADLHSIIEIVPHNKLRKGKYITDKHLAILFELTEAILNALEYKKLRGRPQCTYVIKTKKDGTPYRADPAKIDRKRSQMLHKHSRALRAFYTEFSDPGYIPSSSTLDGIEASFPGIELPDCEDDSNDNLLWVNEKMDLEMDAAAIQKIKDMWSLGIHEEIAIAKEIKYFPLIVKQEIDIMINKGELQEK